MTTAIKHGYGRNPEHDPRSLKFGVAQIVDLAQPLRSRSWILPPGWLLDQKQDSTCVGCAWTAELACRPAPVRIPSGSAGYRYARDQIYRQATMLDDDPSNDGDINSGTSTTAGAKAVKAHGYIGGYHWARTAEEVALAIGYHGPVVIGVNWHSHMNRTSSTGFIYPVGAVGGGHEVLVRAVDVTKRVFTIRNSWGRWGIDGSGDCYLNWDDLDRLLMAGGDACVPDRRIANRTKPVYLEF
jgi:hypothetical protein